MILEKLCEYAERVDDFPPSHFQRRKLDWLIEIDESGNFLNFIDVSDEKDIYLFTDHLLTRTSQVQSHLLGDKASYVFGNVEDGELTKRQKATKEDFLGSVKSCYEETDNDLVLAVLKFLENYNDYDIDFSDISNDDWMSFRVNGKNPLMETKVKDYWQNKQEQEAQNRTDMISECMVCGKNKSIADKHPESIKLAKIGGKGGGSLLISANKNSFESYGLKKSRIAPVCYDCATNYGRAANYLLNKKSNNITIGDLVYLFWTKENQDFNISTLFNDPKPEEVSTYINKVYNGDWSLVDIKSDEFYVLALSANNSRAIVRDWIQTTLFEVKQNIANYFVSMELEDYKNRKFYPINSLASQTAKDFDDIKPIVSESLMSYALKGTPLPSVVLVNTVNRIKADVEYRVTKPRAAIIKMYFVSNSKGGFKVENKLDKNNENPSYLCGRLFSVIETIQRQAISGITATIVDKYYGTASAAPASVFGNLLRKAQHHLAKLRKDESTRGLYHWLDKELQEIMVKIEDFPASLSLQDQALFALGYYQQKAYKMRRRINNDL